MNTSWWVGPPPAPLLPLLLCHASLRASWQAGRRRHRLGRSSEGGLTEGGPRRQTANGVALFSRLSPNNKDADTGKRAVYTCTR